MIEDRQTAYLELEPPTPEEVSSANDILLCMVKTAKGLRIYLPNNPVLIKFLEELSGKMETHLAQYGEFRLDIDRFTLGYKGSCVYENHDPKESIAFRLHADGIGALIFSPGLQQSEVTVFLGIIGVERAVYEDDDIVTQLWEKSLAHVSYLLEEDFAEVDLSDEESQQEPQQEIIGRIRASLAENSIVPLQPIPLRLLALTPEDAEWLRKAREAESQRSPLNDVINILCAVLAGVKNPFIFADFLDIMSNFTVNMFLSGDIGQALRLVRFLDKLTKVGDINAEQREMVKGALAGLLSDRAVEVLQESIDSGDTVSGEDLRELLQILGLPSLGAMCELLGRVEKLKMRKVIIEVLVELGQDDPEVFTPFLSDPRWYLVRNVVLVLSLIETQVALDMIVGLITHREARIRKEVLGFLERSPDPKAKNYLLKFLRDESSALRVKALQILAREKLSFGLKPAVALTTAPDFRSRELSERKQVYETIGELGSEQMVPLFRDMLIKKRWFGKGVDKDTAICAVAGLSRMRNPAALELLEEAGRQRNPPEVKTMIEQAMFAVTTGQGRVQAEAEEA